MTGRRNFFPMTVTRNAREVPASGVLSLTEGSTAEKGNGSWPIVTTGLLKLWVMSFPKH